MEQDLIINTEGPIELKRLLAIALILIIGMSSNVEAQRYIKPVFEKVDMDSVIYLKNDSRRLMMDIYQPQKDPEENRPVLLYVHGGGFSGGKRNEPLIKSFCQNMSRRGLVVVSMSYSLTMKGRGFGCDVPARDKIATFNQAGTEVAGAVNYLINHKSELKINPEQIILSGSSAGAEAVLHAAYSPETQTSLPSGFQYAGVISMAGAIYDLNFVNRTTAIPTQLFHGTCDNLVPYGTAAHHYCDKDDPGYLILYGGQSIADKLKELNKGFYLITGCNGTHGWSGLPMEKYKEVMIDFIQHDVLQNSLRQIREVTKSDKDCSIVDELDICLD